MCRLLLPIVVLSFSLLATGCAKYWYQEGKTFEECQQARDECFKELSKRTDFASPTVEYEIKFMNECMQAKGYREVSEGDLPMEVKRQVPEHSLHWRTRGLAGTVK